LIYLTLSHSLEVVFPSCYAISTFSATPYMPFGTVMGKFMSSETTDVYRSLKTSALPVSASSSKEKRKKERKKERKKKTCVGQSLDFVVYG